MSGVNWTFLCAEPLMEGEWMTATEITNCIQEKYPKYNEETTSALQFGIPLYKVGWRSTVRRELCQRDFDGDNSSSIKEKCFRSKENPTKARARLYTVAEGFRQWAGQKKRKAIPYPQRADLMNATVATNSAKMAAVHDSAKPSAKDNHGMSFQEVLNKTRRNAQEASRRDVNVWDLTWGAPGSQQDQHTQDSPQDQQKMASTWLQTVMRPVANESV